MIRPGALALAICTFCNLPALAETCTVTDGDTIRCGDERIRLKGIDAPELFSPKCREERRLAERARGRLAELVGGVELRVDRAGRDRYRRTLATVYGPQGDVGAVLVAEGLARVWAGRRMPWCR